MFLVTLLGLCASLECDSLGTWLQRQAQPLLPLTPCASVSTAAALAHAIDRTETTTCTVPADLRVISVLTVDELSLFAPLSRAIFGTNTTPATPPGQLDVPHRVGVDRRFFFVALADTGEATFAEETLRTLAGWIRAERAACSTCHFVFHCLQGRSRSPTLAALMAAEPGVLSDTGIPLDRAFEAMGGLGARGRVQPRFQLFEQVLRREAELSLVHGAARLTHAANYVPILVSGWDAASTALVPVRQTAPTSDYLLTDKICDLREGNTASSLVAFSGYSSYSLADEVSVHLVGGRADEAVTPPLLLPGGVDDEDGDRHLFAQVATLDAPARDGRLSVANFVLRESVGGGKFGEVWRGLRVATGETIVLKRLLRGVPSSTASGYREAYFGDLLQGTVGVAPFLTHFFDEAGDLWLVFQDSGVSLYALLYARTRLGAGGYSLSPSEWWRTRLRAGGLKVVMIALLRALSALHATGVVHRDVKPSNILINQTGSLVLCDFGSAVNDQAAANASLYPHGLHERDETVDYQPPEVRLADGSVPPDRHASPAYDVWSAGIVAIELYLGTPSPLTALSGLEWHRSTFEFHSALGTKLRHSAQALEASEPARAARLFVASALADLCVLEACSDQSLATRLSVLDPLRRKPSLHFVRMVRAMLAVDPAERATADQALELAYLL